MPEIPVLTEIDFDIPLGKAAELGTWWAENHDHTPSLGGEWADDPTRLSLFRDVMGYDYWTFKVKNKLGIEDDLLEDLLGAICEAWENAANERYSELHDDEATL